MSYAKKYVNTCVSTFWTVKVVFDNPDNLDIEQNFVGEIDEFWCE